MSAKKDEPTSILSVRVGGGLKKALEAVAYEERRSVSSILGRLIENHVRSYEPKTIARALNAMEVRERAEGYAGEYGDPMDAIMAEVEKLQRQAPLNKAIDKATKKK